MQSGFAELRRLLCCYMPMHIHTIAFSMHVHIHTDHQGVGSYARILSVLCTALSRLFFISTAIRSWVQ